VEGHPYEIEFTFFPGFPIDYSDPDHLFPYYKNLIHWRKTLPALYDGGYEEISVTPNQSVFSFRRYSGSQNVVTILNMGSSSANVTASLPIDEMNLDSSRTYYMTNLLEGDVISGTPGELNTVNVSMEPFSAKVYLLADSIVQITGNLMAANNNIPGSFELSQNYPNPFNPSTTISYSIPLPGKVAVKIFDVLGEEVASLVNAEQSAGLHSVIFNGSRLASGVYLYRVDFQGYSFTKKMMLLK